MSSGPEYVFTRDYLDNNRINLQHYLWKELFGYLLHPKIPLDNKHVRIADIGTGTGIWLTDIAATLPETVVLDGIDISFDAAPPLEYLPSNMTLRKWNVRDAVPEELKEAYNVVHIRNFAFILQDGEIFDVVVKVTQLLRTGGYIQWGEADVSSFRIERPCPEAQASFLMELLKVSQPQDDRLSPRWVPSLPDTFESAGLQVLATDVKDAPRHLAWSSHQCNLVIHELLPRMTKNEEVARKLEEIMPSVCLETKMGSYWEFTRHTVVGRKAKEHAESDLSVQNSVVS